MISTKLTLWGSGNLWGEHGRARAVENLEAPDPGKTTQGAWTGSFISGKC